MYPQSMCKNIKNIKENQQTAKNTCAYFHNVTGWEEEANVSFEDHIFLEDLLEDFPKKGPVRHFMELVTTALSKNPYLTVAQKHEHIDWYRKYFEEKKSVIEESLVHADDEKTLEQASN